LPRRGTDFFVETTMQRMTRAALMRATGRTRREIDELLSAGLPHGVVGAGRGSEIRVDVDKALAWLVSCVLYRADASPAKERLDELRAEKLQLEIDERRGTLVDRAEVNALFHDLGKRMREAWEQWPGRVASEMASRLGAKPHLTLEVLTGFVKANLAATRQAEILRLRRDRAA
jgi:hypothetical protein